MSALPPLSKEMAFRSGAVSAASMDSIDASDPNDALEEFKSLQISIPIESTKYSFLSMFIERAFHLRDPQAILKPASEGSVRAPPVEVLPHIAVPCDIWLQSYISIPHARAKTSILKEVNELLKLHISDLQHENYLVIDEHILAGIEQRVSESQFSELTLPDDEPAPHPDFGPEARRVSSTSSSVLSAESDATFTKLRPPSIPNSSQGRRRPSFSREFMSSRKLSFLGHSPKIQPGSSAESEDDKPSLPPLASPLPSPQMKSQAPANGVWSSRIYNKIRKKRGSELSMASSVESGQSISRPRTDEGFDAAALNSSRKGSFRTAQQQVEIQKEKYEYFTNSKLLGQNIRALVGFLGRTGSRASLARLLEFIKDTIFKFIVADICHMVLRNGEYRGINGWF